MFDNVNSSNIQTESQNAPNLAFATNPILGNISSTLTAPQAKGTRVQPGFPQLSYVGEAEMFFFQNMDNPSSSPYTIYSGSNTGQQVVSGQITQNDANGQSRYSQGFSSSTVA